MPMMAISSLLIAAAGSEDDEMDGSVGIFDMELGSMSPCLNLSSNAYFEAVGEIIITRGADPCHGVKPYLENNNLLS